MHPQRPAAATVGGAVKAGTAAMVPIEETVAREAMAGEAVMGEDASEVDAAEGTEARAVPVVRAELPR